MFMTDMIKNHIEILQTIKSNDIDLYIIFFKNARNPYISYLDNQILIHPSDENENNYYNLIIIILYFIKYFNNARKQEERI
jgi:hypothetical protein